MILEEETYRKYGYYSKDLGPYSTKPVIVACDNCKTRIIKKKAKVTESVTGLCKTCRLLQHNGWPREKYEAIARFIIADPNVHYLTIARKFNISPYNVHRRLKSKYFKKILEEIKNNKKSNNF